jgi:predicted ATPase
VLAGGHQARRLHDTEHYQVMRNFVANPKRMLDVLFAPEDE